MSSGNGVLNTPFELVTSLGFAGFVLLLLAMPLAFWAVSSPVSYTHLRAHETDS